MRVTCISKAVRENITQLYTSNDFKICFHCVSNVCINLTVDNTLFNLYSILESGKAIYIR